MIQIKTTYSYKIIENNYPFMVIDLLNNNIRSLTLLETY